MVSCNTLIVLLHILTYIVLHTQLSCWIMSFGLMTKRTWARMLHCVALGKFFFFTIHCSSLLSCMNGYLTIVSGGYFYEQPSCIDWSVAGCFPEKLRWCLVEQICQGSKVQSVMSDPEDCAI